MSSEDQGYYTKSVCQRICYTWTLKLNAITDLRSKHVSRHFPDYMESIAQFYLEAVWEGDYTYGNINISLRTVCKSDCTNKTKYVNINILNHEKKKSELLKLSDDWKMNMGSIAKYTPNGYFPNTLTIICEIFVISPVDKIMPIEVPKCKLFEDLAALFDTKKNSDVTIVTRDQHEIPAHKAILTGKNNRSN